MEVRLQNVVLPSLHYEETVTFYRDVLGLAILTQGPGFCFFRAGAVNIAVHPANDDEFAPSGSGFYLDLIVSDLGEVKVALERHNVQIKKQWHDANRSFMLVADPDGNLLELIQTRQ